MFGKYASRVNREKELLQRTKQFQSACTEMHASWEPRGARASKTDTGLQHHWHNWDMADQFAGLQCYDGQVQTLQEKQAEKRGSGLRYTWRRCSNIWSSSIAVCLTARVGSLLQSTWWMFKKLKNISRWHTLISMGDFRPPVIC